MRRRHRLRHHHQKACAFRGRGTGGEGGSACLARLRALLSRALSRGRTLSSSPSPRHSRVCSSSISARSCSGVDASLCGTAPTATATFTWPGPVTAPGACMATSLPPSRGHSSSRHKRPSASDRVRCAPACGWFRRWLRFPWQARCWPRLTGSPAATGSEGAWVRNTLSRD